MTFYKNKDYDGEFIFGDVIFHCLEINKDKYSPNKIFLAYIANANKNNNLNGNNILEWAIQFEDIYYEFSTNIINIHNNIIGNFDLNLNIILGSFEYISNIERDFFNFYYEKEICKYNYMRGSTYKFIYCFQNFTQKDLEKFPSLNFRSVKLRYTFNLDYKDLFSLTNDKKYYIFNIMVENDYQDDDKNEEQWILGLPFLKKYQFFFDTNDKLIFFYNKERNVLEDIVKDKNNYYDDTNKNNDTNNNCEIEPEITNNQRITNNKKNNENYISLNKQKNHIIYFINFFFEFFSFINKLLLFLLDE